MTDSARSYVRAAQQAELRGDLTGSAALLREAAALYRQAGQLVQALRMLRHAVRLAGQPEALDDLARLEASMAGELPSEPERPPAPALEASRGGELPPKPERPSTSGAPAHAARVDFGTYLERGPALADPSLEAWCSFCCRPRQEVGLSVAGPAGAFICRGCAGEAGRLLGLPPPGARPSETGAEGTFGSQAGADRLERPALPPAGFEEVLAALAGALQAGLRWTLLLGPAGAGKTACLLELERRGLGRRVSPGLDAAGIGAGERLLVDGVEGDALSLLVDQLQPLAIQAVIAVRGESPAGWIRLRQGELELALASPEELVAGSAGRLPRQLAERLQTVIPLRPPKAAALAALGRSLAAARSELSLEERALAALIGQAEGSPSPAHALWARLASLPPGRWELSGVPAPRARPGKRGR